MIHKFFWILILTLSFITNSEAKSRNSPIRSFGDVMQIVNPVVSSLVASQERGFGHHAIIYSQTWLTMHGTKLIGREAKWSIGKRPFIEGKRNRYDGMPSGHTASAFAAASYVRVFSDDYKYLSIPLYVTAAVTGYSRVYSKEHTVAQVLSGAALAEVVTFINSKLAWSNNYTYTKITANPKSAIVSFEFRF